MKKFETPKMEIVEVENDVITCSKEDCGPGYAIACGGGMIVCPPDCGAHQWA